MTTNPFADPIFKSIPSVICIGVFDGMHPGHLAIVGETVNLAKKLGARSVVITFSTNPKMGTGSKLSQCSLQSVADLTELLTIRGIDYHCVIDFSEDMSKLSGEEFIAFLCTSYRMQAMVVGNSFRCGTPALSAGPAEIEKLLCTYAPSAILSVVPQVLHNGTVVSSSLIRRCLLQGETEKVSGLLGRPYNLDMGNLNPVCGSGGRLLYSTDSICQLLPCAGTYRVEVAGFAEDASMPGPVDCDASAVISGDCLALNLPEKIRPDRIFFL